jgi:hypothetical protein
MFDIRLHRRMDNEMFRREILKESFGALRVDTVTLAFPFSKFRFKFMDHKVISINWMK